ncbi:helicase [Bacteroidia bacterium]|nr:helicase [Bacteroidia bacterium]
MNNLASLIEDVKKALLPTELAHGEILFNNNDCTILSQSAVSIDFMVIDDGKQMEVSLIFDNDGNNLHIVPECDGERTGWNRYTYSCLLQYDTELKQLQPKDITEHKKYSRQGMIKRVLNERWMKAEKADYRIKWADNVFGDHILTNEKGIRYKIFLRDFENETGYSDSSDSRLNKLGTTKHIMYAFRKLKEDKALYNRLSKIYPFIEIYCDPLNDYKISWHYEGEMPLDEKLLISKFFKKSTCIEDSEVETFLQFIEEATNYETICIRPEVKEKVERRYEELMLNELQKKQEIDFSSAHAQLFPYQTEGVKFALFRKAAIIADEMGLGKTIQAIVTATLKKQVFGFRKTLIVCPATLKSQWKKEIEKFTDEKALILSGTPEERAKQYQDDNYFFFIINYETILRDSLAINKADFDFLILDEAQKIKNYETKTASSVNRLKYKHVLVITGTPIENRLIDIFSIISTIDPYFLGPLWEFSYQHCLFDPEKPNKINGYYDLNPLNEKLSHILIRREKSAVLSQLPAVQQIDVPVKLSPMQSEYHAGYMQGISQIIRKKFLTPYDLQKLTLLLNSARMVCDSTYLIDDETNESPKLEELRDILFEKLDIQNTNRKIIIFSEWVKVHKLIGQLLRENNIGFVELNGKIPVHLRGELIRKFETTPECKIFLSTEAGGAGLNLQVADILINFELPWNPAKKNQRIGRIDRLGQKSHKLTIYNFITRFSIEQNIAAGLLVKQNLFDGVLSDKNTTNYVDFSSKGRSQFIQQIEAMIKEQELRAEQKEDDLSENQLIETPATELVADSSDVVQLELFEEQEEQQKEQERIETEKKSAEIEQVMNSGMQFLAGLFKMSTGKDIGLENQKIEIDRETGEVVMRFKLG